MIIEETIKGGNIIIITNRINTKEKMILKVKKGNIIILDKDPIINKKK